MFKIFLYEFMRIEKSQAALFYFTEGAKESAVAISPKLAR